MNLGRGGRFERSRTGGRKGGGKPASPLRATLGRPHVDSVARSKHANMKELRVQHRGRPYRVLFAFDPRRTAILLIGGNKTGMGRWYKEFMPMGDTTNIWTLRREGLLNG